jgi:hypothetical protein
MSRRELVPVQIFLVQASNKSHTQISVSERPDRGRGVINQQNTCINKHTRARHAASCTSSGRNLPIRFEDTTEASSCSAIPLPVDPFELVRPWYIPLNIQDHSFEEEMPSLSSRNLDTGRLVA